MEYEEACGCPDCPDPGCWIDEEDEDPDELDFDHAAEPEYEADGDDET